MDTACTCVASIPSGSNERQLAVGTKRGEVAILDLRRRPATVLFNPSAHEGSALRSISFDSATDTLTTAGADGLVKVIVTITLHTFHVINATMWSDSSQGLASL